MDGLATEDISTLLRWLEDGPAGTIPIDFADRSLGRLQAVTWEDAGDREVIHRLGRWHEHAFAWFPEPFPVSAEGARRWLIDRVLSDPTRIFFWVRDVRGEAVAHIGLKAIDLDAAVATIGDVILSHPKVASLVSAAVESLALWVRRELGLRIEWTSQARATAA